MKARLSRNTLQTAFALVFLLYLWVLFRLTLFRTTFTLAGFHFVGQGREHVSFRQERSMANLVPFHMIRYYATGQEPWYVDFVNLMGNVVIFVPFGLMVPLLFPKTRRFARMLLLSAGLSLFIEIMQFITRTGVFDVDDIILNTIGGATGYAGWRLLFALWYRKRAPRGQPNI
jgi:glycopeptide antibiotics resistance protein